MSFLSTHITPEIKVTMWTMCSAVMLAAKRSASVMWTPPPSANKAAHSDFETQRCHQKSKTGVSVTSQKGLVGLPNVFFKKCAIGIMFLTTVYFWSVQYHMFTTVADPREAFRHAPQGPKISIHFIQFFWANRIMKLSIVYFFWTLV